MSYNIIATPNFKRDIKRLSKKFKSLKSEFISLVESLENEPLQGDHIGNNCYKIRLSIASKGKGKSGGARVITHIQVIKSTVYLLSIDRKSVV